MYKLFYFISDCIQRLGTNQFAFVVFLVEKIWQALEDEFGNVLGKILKCGALFTTKIVFQIHTFSLFLACMCKLNITKTYGQYALSLGSNSTCPDPIIGTGSESLEFRGHSLATEKYLL